MLGSVVVVGGCGFVGTNLVLSLLKDPSCTSVSVISRNATKNVQSGAKYYSCSMLDESRFQSLLSTIQPRVIFNSVCVAGLQDGSFSEQYDTNVAGVKVLLRCAAATPSVQAFVHVSTDSVLKKPRHQTAPMTEDITGLWAIDDKAGNGYQKTKAVGERLVLSANSRTFKTVALRPPIIYGEYDTIFMPGVIANWGDGKTKVQVGGNEKLFEYVYVGNLVQGLILAAEALLREKPDQGKRIDGEAFFITDGISLPFWDFTKKLWVALGDSKPDEVKVIPHWLVLWGCIVTEWLYWTFTLGMKKPAMNSEDILYLDTGCWLSIDKARERLGYVPIVDMDEATRRSVKWALENKR